MDRNRKILVSILALLVLASILAIVDISLNMQRVKKREFYTISTPGIGPGIGIVRIVGPIEFTFGLMDRGAESILRRLSDLELDSRIKAIVIRINSPGGTVAATQEIFRKLLKLKKKNKILVVSMGDIATSGAYYIASASNHIIANHGSITGSIGVIAVSPNLKGLFEKLGIRMNVIKSGKYKDILASYKNITDEERELIQGMIDSSYKQFLKDVSLGRNMPISDIQPYADGRVTNGETALKYKLIDSIGSFEDAIEKARSLAKLPDDCAIYDDIKTPFERFFMKLENLFLNRPAFPKSIEYKRNYMIEYRYSQ